MVHVVPFQCRFCHEINLSLFFFYMKIVIMIIILQRISYNNICVSNEWNQKNRIKWFRGLPVFVTVPLQGNCLEGDIQLRKYWEFDAQYFTFINNSDQACFHNILHKFVTCLILHTCTYALLNRVVFTLNSHCSKKMAYKYPLAIITRTIQYILGLHYSIPLKQHKTNKKTQCSPRLNAIPTKFSAEFLSFGERG